MSYRHSIAVRYGEVDMQRVVFNANYLAYCDDAVETWWRSVGLRDTVPEWDMMLKRAVVEWQGSATVAEVVDIEVGVTRWGTTSFDVGFTGTVGERPVFTATITYVGVALGTTTPTPPPAAAKAALGGP